MKQNGQKIDRNRTGTLIAVSLYERTRTAVTCGFFQSGPGRTRTDDTRGVNAMLYQLSYRPFMPNDASRTTNPNDGRKNAATVNYSAASASR